MLERQFIQIEGNGANPIPTLQKSEYVVKDTELHIAQNLVKQYHYAKGGSNTRVYVHGLYNKKDENKCLGVAWWIPPTRSCAEASYHGDWKKVIALSRLVLVPGLPTNSASFLISKSILLIKKDGRFECLLTYADDYQDHVGTIYKATNWEYLGKIKPTPCWVDSTGRMVATKAGPKTRTIEEMMRLGYKYIGRFSKHKFRIILNYDHKLT